MSQNRTSLLYGRGAAEKLSAARVAVCGVGAVGSFAAEALARLGVGAFDLYDFDAFEPSNINRQLCALHSTLGLAKVEVQKRRILDINPGAEVSARAARIDEALAGEIAASGADLIVDAVDDVSAKVALALAASRAGVALVSSMGAARRKDPLAVRAADIFATSGCPLAAEIRRRLRKASMRGGYKCVYSAEPAIEGTALPPGGVSPAKVLGSSVVVVGVFGLNLANLALAEILSAPQRRR